MKSKIKNPTVTSNGEQCWYNATGQIHREDKPALISANGDQCWCKDGKLHNLNGPAVIRADGTIAYFINNKEYSEEEFKFWSKCHETIS